MNYANFPLDKRMPLPSADQEKGEDFIDVERLLGMAARQAKVVAVCAIIDTHMHPKDGHYAASSRRSCVRTNCCSISKTGPFMSSRASAKAIVASMKPSLEPQSNMRPWNGWA